MKITQEKNSKYIITKKGKEIGFINFYKEDNFLKSIKIYSKYRGKGYGKATIQKLYKKNQKLFISKIQHQKMKGILMDLEFKKEKGLTKNNNFQYYWSKNDEN